MRPLATALPISRIDLIFGADRPSRLSLSARARRTASWWNGSKAANSRSRIAAALAVESCWPQTMAHRPAKPASRRRRLKAPAFSATGSSRGSAAISCASAGFEIGLVWRKWVMRYSV